MKISYKLYALFTYAVLFQGLIVADALDDAKSFIDSSKKELEGIQKFIGKKKNEAIQKEHAKSQGKSSSSSSNWNDGVVKHGGVSKDSIEKGIKEGKQIQNTPAPAPAKPSDYSWDDLKRDVKGEQQGMDDLQPATQSDEASASLWQRTKNWFSGKNKK